MNSIKTERLNLVRPIMTPSPIQANVDWLNDPEIVRYSEQRHTKHTVEGQIQYIKSFDHPSRFLMMIFNDQIIGTMTAHVDTDNDVADVGIMIGDKSMWGKGLGFEAWEGLCDHLLANGIRKVEAGAMSENRGMVAIFRKYGMVYEGRRFGHFLLGKEVCDLVQWGKFGG
jgi:ribosomal-protein-alanine N-acetyltransferase